MFNYPTGSIDIVLRGVGQKSRVGALDVLSDLPFKLAVVALSLVELPVIRTSGSPFRARLQELANPVQQWSLLPGHLDQGHHGDQDDGGEGDQPAEEVGPVGVVVVTVLVTGVVQGREQQDTLRFTFIVPTYTKAVCSITLFAVVSPINISSPAPLVALSNRAATLTASPIAE